MTFNGRGLFGSGIRSRLLTVGLLPVLAMCLVLVRSAVHDVADYRAAREVATASTSVVDLSRLDSVLRTEWVASLDMTAVVTSDFLSTSELLTDRAANTLDIDVRQRFELAIVKSNDELATSSVIPVEAVDRIEQLDGIRRRTGSGTITPAELDLFYLRLIGSIEDELENQSDIIVVSGDSDTREAIQAQAVLSDLVASSGTLRGELTRATERLIVGAPAEWEELDVAARSTLNDIDEVDALDSTRFLDDWNQASFELHLAIDSIDGLTTAKPLPNDPDLESITADLIDARVATLEATLEGWTLLDNAVQDIARSASRQRQEALRSLAISFTLFMLSIIVFLFAVARISRSIIAPLERAAAIANRVGRGELTRERVGDDGPVEVQAVSVALNDLIETLAVIERQADALATGDSESDALDLRLPGDLGQTLESTVGRWREVTEQSQAANALNEAIAVATSDAQFLCDSDLTVIEANPSAAELFGLDACELTGQNIDCLLTLDKGQRLTDQLAKTNQFAGEGTVDRDTDDRQVAVIVTATRVVSANRTVHAITIRDVSERQELLDRLSQQIRHDSLTGLISRRHILELLETTLQTEPAGLVVLGLDRFKVINDQSGQAVGDLLLKQVANRLRSTCRTEDLVARMGGDEFVVVTPGLNCLETLRAYGDRLLEELKRPIEAGGRTVSLTASLGVAIADVPDPDKVLQEANLAQHEAKTSGGNQVVAYDEALMAVLANNSRIEAELVEAMRTNRLALWFQPVIDATTNRVVSTEALIRWPQPDGTIRPPVEFVPLAEQSDLIVQLDRWVIDAACRQLAAWDNTDLAEIRVAINISVRHFTEADLHDSIRAATLRWGVEPSRLSIEVTESYLADDLERMRQTLDELHQLGVRLLLDDFGTGYSSLSYLQELPFDVLKIDRAFVARLDDEESSRSIVRALVTLGHTMGLKVVAEGIETDLQLDALRAIGCDLFQGFLLARPMPPESLRETHHRSTMADI